MKQHYLFFTMLLICGLLGFRPARAQATTEAAAAGPEQQHRNVVRLDVLSPAVHTLINSLLESNGVTIPVLASYERHLTGRWSLGAEGFLRGGSTPDRGSGAALQARYYLTGAERAPLTGLYVAPVVSYRLRRVVYMGSTNRQGHRGGAGFLLGYQLPLGPAARARFVLDGAAGAMAWTRLGSDQQVQPLASPEQPLPIGGTGLVPDARLGLGYRF
ncbi:hypothetical protein LJY25_05835 [Hymenobacter sp. BT175]|uniref:hypothetical protein n=1 Tax=Hymenobacter translucens TaxID=2886507 RepID=UPI001D0EBF60|nr:hypothetical protein [Hymenobacter translucens]MCC2545957.1 hypothetical protein [Hymenobacter translucens]